MSAGRTPLSVINGFLSSAAILQYKWFWQPEHVIRIWRGFKQFKQEFYFSESILSISKGQLYDTFKLSVRVVPLPLPLAFMP